MNDPKYHPGDLVRLNEKGHDWWGYDEETFRVADHSFEVVELVNDPHRGRLYILHGFPYPVAEDELMTEDEYELEYGPGNDNSNL